MPRKPSRRAKPPRSLEEIAAAALEGFPGGSRFLAAVSGGADSTAMLALLAALSRERGFPLRCFHVDHGIRPAGESRGDAEAVRDLASRLGVPWRICRVPQGAIARAAKRRGSGIEAAARSFRHAAWNRERRRIGAARILVAHSRDDLLENVLMAFLRGSGPAGISAMPASRGRILRPLLEADRRMILGWLAAKGIPWREDSTNGDVSLLRNRVRLLLVPSLDRDFPSWRTALLRLAATQRLAADFLAAEAARLLPGPGGISGEPSLSIDGGRFFSAPLPVREEALFLGWDRLARGKPRRGFPEPDPVPGKRAARRPGRNAVRRFAEGKSGAMDMGPLRGELTGDRVRLAPSRRGTPWEGFSRIISRPGRYVFGGLSLTVAPSPGDFPEPEGDRGDILRLELPLVLRSRLPADLPLVQSLESPRLLEYTGTMVLCDRRGRTALIGVSPGKARVLARAGDEPEEGVSVLAGPDPSGDSRKTG